MKKFQSHLQPTPIAGANELAKGADALFSSFKSLNQNQSTAKDNSLLLPLHQIEKPNKQPRRHFDEEAINDLALSIKEHGILEPLIVRPLSEEKYELVVGERRYRAAHIAKLKDVPVLIKELTAKQAWELALVENVQRQDLNPIDRVDAVLQELAFKLDCSAQEARSLLYRIENENKGKVTRSESGNAQREIVERVFELLGIKFSQFMRFELPLLNAPQTILDAVRAGKIDVRNAYEIKKVKDTHAQQALLDEAIKNKLSVEQIKQHIKTLKDTSQTSEAQPGDALKTEITDSLTKLKRNSTWKTLNAKQRRKLERVNTLLHEILTNT